MDGELVTVKPHDLRRTYARLLYEAGMDPVEIQQNLGHADQREPPSVFSVDLSELPRGSS